MLNYGTLPVGPGAGCWGQRHVQQVGRVGRVGSAGVTGGTCPLPGDPRRILPHFSLRGVSNYDVLLLSKDEDTLYVGARDTILSLGVDSTGTMAFKNLVSRGWQHGVQAWVLILPPAPTRGPTESCRASVSPGKGQPAGDCW